VYIDGFRFYYKSNVRCVDRSYSISGILYGELLMSLMPIYYNANKLGSKRKKLSEKEKRLRKEQELWIRKRFGGKSGGPQILASEKIVPHTESKEVRLLKEICGYDGSPCLKKTSPTLKGSYIIGQAYNKGNLVVLSRKDAKDSATGKRR
jgi:hypothetical protein|tara:strand:- start:33 stop:482 length:450 start_codon:yes stop_codon:yes gene_type:complete